MSVKLSGGLTLSATHRLRGWEHFEHTFASNAAAQARPADGFFEHGQYTRGVSAEAVIGGKRDFKLVVL